MVRQRVRIRFRKEGDLRLIGHQDLMRVLERLFRRCKLSLQMTQGFTPRLKMTHPLALAVGVVGTNEVMEIELSEEYQPDQLLAKLQTHSVEGLHFESVEVLPPGSKNAQVSQVTYEIPVPVQRQPQLNHALESFLAQKEHPITRPKNGRVIDLREPIKELSLSEHTLRMTLQITPEGSVRPREILEVLGFPDYEREGSVIRRTAVEIAP